MKSVENKNEANKGALSGILVLDLSRLLPGPFCSMILADHGARVISVEDKRFLSDDLFISEVNRNKEHMSLNLKTQEGKEIFSRLVNKADVLLEGFRPGVVQRLGIVRVFLILWANRIDHPPFQVSKLGTSQGEE